MFKERPNTPPIIDGRLLNATADSPDLRDYMYQPALVRLADEKKPLADPIILDQGQEGACVGFALAAVIHLLKAERYDRAEVSARMLYEMAKIFDEWEGEEYSGSSCRGAIRGFYHMGVCRDILWRYEPNNPGELTNERADDAMATTLGAYYRLRPRLSDFHAALNETGVLFVSAKVHEGWSSREIRDATIPLGSTITGAHAFAIVGYDADGFWVQNSWGKAWGRSGLARWTYEDWQRNLLDAWVLRLALSTPKFPVLGNATFSRTERLLAERRCFPRRSEIRDHFIHIDDGEFHLKGKYFSNRPSVKSIAEKIVDLIDHPRDSHKPCQHLLLWAHGGLVGPRASARRIKALRDTYMSNGIYPLHFMWDTGLFEEIIDVISRSRTQIRKRVGGNIFDLSDYFIERLLRKPIRAVWREIKRGAETAFQTGGAGLETIDILLEALEGKAVKIHLLGHSAGAVLVAHLIRSLQAKYPNLRISTCSLLAPAATVELYKSHLKGPILNRGDGFGIDDTAVYCLGDKLERDGRAGPYRKSILYLISNAAEEKLNGKKRQIPIMGMQKFRSKMRVPSGVPLEFIYSPHTGRCGSERHGGFDNDPATMNDILRRILGREPTPAFTEEILDFEKC